MIQENMKKTFQNWLKARMSAKIDCNCEGQFYTQHDTRKQEQNIPELAESHTVYLR